MGLALKYHAKKTIISWFLGQSGSLFSPLEPFVFILSESNHMPPQLVTNDHINLQYSSTSCHCHSNFLFSVKAAEGKERAVGRFRQQLIQETTPSALDGVSFVAVAVSVLVALRRPLRPQSDNKTTRGSSNAELKEKAYLVSRG